METKKLGFIHRFVPSPNGSARTLLLLHGTGGNENDLISLGSALDPDAALLSPRGKVLENGASRFFRRLAEGVFDEDDIRLRAAELAQFITDAAQEYGLDAGGLVAAGFSNGANIAASLLLLHPNALEAALLLHPMVPLVPETTPDLEGVHVLITAGRRDPIVSPPETERLANLLRDANATTDVFWQNDGHTLTQEEVNHAKRWLSRLARHRQTN